MFFKTLKNFAPKCIIFAENFLKFSGEGTQPPGSTPTFSLLYSKFLHPPLVKSVTDTFKMSYKS